MPPDFHQLDWNAAIEDDLRQIVRLSVREDLDRQNDWTTLALVASETQGRAAVVARQPGVVAGLRAAPVLLDEMQASIEWQPQADDGGEISAGDCIAEITGSARDMLTCERPLLNLLGRLSGIATLTRQYVRRVEGTQARIYDTRKTTPGWRRLEKYAVRCGGGNNHRTGLFDAILIKDNHLSLAAQKNASPAEAVRTAREFLAQFAPLPKVPNELLVEIEVDTLEQFEAVLNARPDLVLLDNMTPDQLRRAVERRNQIAPDIELEASGGISVENIRDSALAGIERISVGALTHSARWLDIGLDWWQPAIAGPV
ncbi:MAG TPA: carboxylating nicotinate-nucleotide diphosphorylase [Lacipirellulaceae bacterium]|nr:carboxylating nicotinate-nucleotide diphosphorylase [Lacipirellulaceae bacterium]